MPVVASSVGVNAGGAGVDPFEQFRRAQQGRAGGRSWQAGPNVSVEDFDIGAGGFGERIVTGLALNDHATLLAGAIPAAALALLIEASFGYSERWLIPQGLRLAAER